MQLKNFEVNIAQLRAKETNCFFRAWLEDWEKPLLKNNVVVAEVRLLEKYKDLTCFIQTMSACALFGQGI